MRERKSNYARNNVQMVWSCIHFVCQISGIQNVITQNVVPGCKRVYKSGNSTSCMCMDVHWLQAVQERQWAPTFSIFYKIFLQNANMTFIFFCMSLIRGLESPIRPQVYLQRGKQGAMFLCQMQSFRLSPRYRIPDYSFQFLRINRRYI